MSEVRLTFETLDGATLQSSSASRTQKMKVLVSEVQSTFDTFDEARLRPSGALRTQKMECFGVRGPSDLRDSVRGDAVVVGCIEHAGNELNLCPRSIRPSTHSMGDAAVVECLAHSGNEKI